jgi:hypothetical protein
MNHAHGPHECYCPSCGCTLTVGTGEQCSAQTCPCCGQAMRALETGEYRSGIAQGSETGGWLLKLALGVGGGLAFLAVLGALASGVKEVKEEKK